MTLPAILCLLLFVSACGLLLAGFPVAFTLAGTSLIFAMIGWLAGVIDMSFLTAFPQRIFATMTNEVLVAVPLFVFMGVMLERSKVAEDLLDSMGRAFGSLPGGIAYSVTIVGMLLAASTGIVGATVVTMGLLSLPVMLKRNYSRSFACGSIAACGTLGQIIPPSIVLVLLGDQLSVAFQHAQFAQGIFAPDTVSVNDLFAGALLPGLMLVGMYLLYQVAIAVLRPDWAPAIPKDELITESTLEFARRLARVLFTPIILIVAVLGSILSGLASPTEAAGVGAVGATLLAGQKIDPGRAKPILLGAACFAGVLVLTVYFDLRMQRTVISPGTWVAIVAAIVLSIGLAWGIIVALWRTLAQKGPDGVSVLASVARSTTQISSMVFVILVGASLFALVFRGFGGDTYVENFLHELPGGTVGAILMVMLVMFVLGFFLDFLEIVFIVVPIVAPILLQMEVAPGELMSPVWLGVMMGINLQTSFLTPPFGFALFYLRGVAPPAVTTGDIYRGVVPFVAIQLMALAVLWIFPGLATSLPLALYGR
ncbi:MAG TPA: TRAP transporter large permease subunit [Aestuariivirgaceae bacterium]|nr:TRAP transporter large permease subunit [Aestuariivirgaceae bacterium]